MKKLVIFLLALLFSFGVSSVFKSETPVYASSDGVSLGMYNSEADLFVVHKVQQNETIKMYVGQTFVSENWVADYKISGKNPDSVGFNLGGSRWTITALKAGSATVQLLDPDNEEILTFNVEAVKFQSEEAIDTELASIVLKTASYIKLGEDGKVNEYLKLNVNNGTSKTIKAAAVLWETKREEPKYGTVKTKKTKSLKSVVKTFDSVDEAKGELGLSSKQVKKLKKGKTVVLGKNPEAYVVQYSGFYFIMFME